MKLLAHITETGPQARGFDEQLMCCSLEVFSVPEAMEEFLLQDIVVGNYVEVVVEPSTKGERAIRDHGKRDPLAAAAALYKIEGLAVQNKKGMLLDAGRFVWVSNHSSPSTAKPWWNRKFVKVLCTGAW